MPRYYPASPLTYLSLHCTLPSPLSYTHTFPLSLLTPSPSSPNAPSPLPPLYFSPRPSHSSPLSPHTPFPSPLSPLRPSSPREYLLVALSEQVPLKDIIWRYQREKGKLSNENGAGEEGRLPHLLQYWAFTSRFCSICMLSAHIGTTGLEFMPFFIIVVGIRLFIWLFNNIQHYFCCFFYVLFSCLLFFLFFPRFKVEKQMWKRICQKRFKKKR